MNEEPKSWCKDHIRYVIGCPDCFEANDKILNAGFWRSARGDNHGHNSQPGDVWIDHETFSAEIVRSERLEKLSSALLIENKRLVDELVKVTGYLASVRTDRRHKDADGNVYALQMMDWATGALEYAEAANAVLQ